MKVEELFRHLLEGNVLPLPLALLTQDPRILETFERWGLRTFRNLAALPENGLAERLGMTPVEKLAKPDGRRPKSKRSKPRLWACRRIWYMRTFPGPWGASAASKADWR